MGENEARRIIGLFISATFEFFMFIVNILLYSIILLGAISASILLYSMFPEKAMIVLDPFFALFKVLWQLLRISLLVLLALSIGYITTIYIGLWKNLISNKKQKDYSRHRAMRFEVKEMIREELRRNNGRKRSRH